MLTHYWYTLFNLWLKHNFLSPVLALLLLRHVTFPTMTLSVQHTHCSAIPSLVPTELLPPCSVPRSSITVRQQRDSQQGCRVSTGTTSDRVRESWSNTRNWKLITKQLTPTEPYPCQWMLLPSEPRETQSIIIQPFYILYIFTRTQYLVLLREPHHSTSKQVACSAEDP